MRKFKLVLLYLLLCLLACGMSAFILGSRAVPVKFSKIHTATPWGRRSLLPPERAGISWKDGVMTYTPSNPVVPRVLIALIAAGEQFRDAHAKYIASHMSYAEKYGFYLVLETRKVDACVNDTQHLFLQHFGVDLTIGPYLLNESSYQGFGWRNGWAKPFLLLRQLLYDYEWIFYIDVEHPLKDSSFLNSLERSISKRAPGFSLTDFYVIRPQLWIHSNVLMIRNSKISFDFVVQWANHSDCDCWVDQAALWLEHARAMLRWRGLDQSLVPCSHLWSSQVLKDEFFEDMRGHWVCKTMNKLCTTTREGPMQCSCYPEQWGECLVDDFLNKTLQYNFEQQLPPNFFWVDEADFMGQRGEKVEPRFRVPNFAALLAQYANNATVLDARRSRASYRQHNNTHTV